MINFIFKKHFFNYNILINKFFIIKLTNNIYYHKYNNITFLNRTQFCKTIHYY